jgi:hypothetical protein
MDPTRNPYSPGAGIKPPELAGRDSELNSFRVLCRRAEKGMASQSVMMSGLRGVGKTVLLNEMAAEARRSGWIVAKVEVDRTGDHKGFRGQVARSLNLSLRALTGKKEPGRSFKGALATFKSFSLKIDPSGSLAIGIDVDARPGRADTGSLEVDLEELAMDLAAAAQERRVGVALFVDELQDLPGEDLKAIPQACHEAGQQSLPFYVVGAGLPSLPGLLAEAQSYAERLFTYWKIGALRPPEASEALVKPAEAEQVHWEPAAVNVLVQASGGYPFFLQEFGKRTWDTAKGPLIAEAEAIAGVHFGTLALDEGFFPARWQRSTPSEREYMRAMAEDGDGPSSSGDIVRRLNKKRASLLGPTRAKLIAKGLVYSPEHGLIAFTVPGMAGFIGRHPE